MPINEDIIESLQVIFDEKQSFFQNHTIDPPKEGSEKEPDSKVLASQAKEGMLELLIT